MVFQFYKKCFFIVSIIMFFTHIHTSKSQHPSMQLTKDQERILTEESQKNLFLSLQYYNKNNQLADFIKEELYTAKTSEEEEKEKLNKTALELIQIYAKFGNIDDNKSKMMIEKCIGFIFYELYKRESEKRIKFLEKKLKKSSENLFGFRPFNSLINEYEKILKSSSKSNIKKDISHAKIMFLLSFNNLYEESKRSHNFIKPDPEPEKMTNPPEKLPTPIQIPTSPTPSNLETYASKTGEIKQSETLIDLKLKTVEELIAKANDVIVFVDKKIWVTNQLLELENWNVLKNDSLIGNIKVLNNILRLLLSKYAAELSSSCAAPDNIKQLENNIIEIGCKCLEYDFILAGKSIPKAEMINDPRWSKIFDDFKPNLPVDRINQKIKYFKMKFSEENLDKINKSAPVTTSTDKSNETNNNSAKSKPYFKLLIAVFGIGFLGYKFYQYQKNK